MKKIVNIFLSLMLVLMFMPISNISADENNIPIEIQEKLNTYITYPNNINTWEEMESDAVVVYIDGYKITRGDYIKLNDYAYKVDASKITVDDYMYNTRSFLSSYVPLGYTSDTRLPYKTAIMHYKTSYGTLYTHSVVRTYATTNIIINWLNNNPNVIDYGEMGQDFVETIAPGLIVGIITESVPIGLFASMVYGSVKGYQNLAARNAFRTFAAGGNGGYSDVIVNEDGDKTIGYGVWNQSTIEVRSGSANGQSILTTYERSIVG